MLLCFNTKNYLFNFHETFVSFLETIHAASWLLEELELPSDRPTHARAVTCRGHVCIRPTHMAAEIDSHASYNF